MPLANQYNKREAFEQLIREHHVSLRAFVRSLGVDADWVDDLAQDALLLAYREWDTFDQSRDFGKWVRGIAANLVRNEIRKKSRRQRLINSDIATAILELKPKDLAHFEPIRIVAIKDCVDQLAPKSRQVIDERYEKGRSAPEISEKLGLSAANVNQMLVRIRRKLKICLETKLGSLS